jgi:Ca2+-binding RTX toxin-like protein
VFGFAADAARVSADAPPPDTTPSDTGGGFIFNLQEGTPANDRLPGSDDADLASGGAGDDTLLGSPGPDTIDGGSGRDTVAYEDPASAFTLAIGKGELSISGGSAGTDLLLDVEALEFGDGTGLDLDMLTGVASLSPDALRALTEMYIAYFDRAPDAEGLYYWGSRLADGMTMEEIARSFFTQDESVAAFPDPGDSAALVDAAYRNLLERDADAEGRAYWIGALDSGDVSKAEFMLALISGAKTNAAAGDDVRTITAKADLGLYYAAINGLSNVSVAEAAMGLFEPGNAGASLAAARGLIDGFAAEARDGDGIGDEFTMPLVGVVEDPFLA